MEVMFELDKDIFRVVRVKGLECVFKKEWREELEIVNEV